MKTDCEKKSQRYAYEGDSDWEVHRAFPGCGSCVDE